MCFLLPSRYWILEIIPTEENIWSLCCAERESLSHAVSQWNGALVISTLTGLVIYRTSQVYILFNSMNLGWWERMSASSWCIIAAEFTCYWYYQSTTLTVVIVLSSKCFGKDVIGLVISFFIGNCYIRCNFVIVFNFYIKKRKNK